MTVASQPSYVTSGHGAEKTCSLLSLRVKIKKLNIIHTIACDVFGMIHLTSKTFCYM